VTGPLSACLPLTTRRAEACCTHPGPARSSVKEPVELRLEGEQLGAIRWWEGRCGAGGHGPDRRLQRLVRLVHRSTICASQAADLRRTRGDDYSSGWISHPGSLTSTPQCPPALVVRPTGTAGREGPSAHGADLAAGPGGTMRRDEDRLFVSSPLIARSSRVAAGPRDRPAHLLVVAPRSSQLRLIVLQHVMFISTPPAPSQSAPHRRS
jgi:hypothetical protein